MVSYVALFLLWVFIIAHLDNLFSSSDMPVLRICQIGTIIFALVLVLVYGFR